MADRAPASKRRGRLLRDADSLGFRTDYAFRRNSVTDSAEAQRFATVDPWFFFTTFLEDLSMKRFSVLALFAFAAMLFIGGMAQATVITAGYYHLGEADTGATVGGAISTLTDSSGNARDLTGGTAVYSSDVAASAVAAVGSTMSVAYAGSSGAGTMNSPPLTDATDNFGIEGWFKRTTGATDWEVMAFNGNPGQDGWGLYCREGQVCGLWGALAWVDSGFYPTTDEWFYAAVVRNNGVGQIYINNSAPVGSLATAPIAPGAANSIAIGGMNAEAWHGSADEVRVFTFEPGAFNASTDLLINQVVPEPSTLALLAMSVLGLIACAWRKRKQ
jgi:hypothetical protein